MTPQIIAAYAESANGPGWANSPVWLILRDGNGKLHQECLQPDEQTPEIAALYSVSQAAHLAMTRAVRNALRDRSAKRSTKARINAAMKGAP